MSEASHAVALARDQERRIAREKIEKLQRELAQANENRFALWQEEHYQRNRANKAEAENEELTRDNEYLTRHLALAEIRIEELEAANREEAIRGR